jgi:hypothetical protein
MGLMDLLGNPLGSDTGNHKYHIRCQFDTQEDRPVPAEKIFDTPGEAKAFLMSILSSGHTVTYLEYARRLG